MSETLKTYDLLKSKKRLSKLSSPYNLACESLFGNIRFLEDDLTEYSEKMKNQQKNDLAQKSRQIGRIISLIAILRPIVKFTKLLH